MYDLIENQARLTDHGFRPGRQMTLDIVSQALHKVNARQAVLNTVRLEHETLHIQDRSFDLSSVRHIYVIGAGKATYPMAAALEDILGERIPQGLIAVKDGQLGPLNWIQGMEAAHPVPDLRSLEAGRRIREIARTAGRDDLIICLMSGGVSSLCCDPANGIDFSDKMQASRLMVNSGADIEDIMTVRGHLSGIKQGRLAHVMHPATMISLTVSDAVGDPMRLNTDWTSPVHSTRQDAVRIIQKFGLWERMPESVRRLLSQAESVPQPSSAHEAYRIFNFMVVKTEELADAAANRARELGLNTLVLTTSLSGESREAGRFLASIAREVIGRHRPAAPPCALIATGETAVRIETEDYGLGGRNQEFAAGACLDLKPDDPIAVCALGTDGTDGPTPAAGALTDGFTIQRAGEKGLDIHHSLRRHDILPFLTALDEAIFTAETQTNVCDISVAIILRS